MLNYNLLKISKGSGKLEDIQSLNTNTLTNPFCIKQNKNKNSICNKCYSINMLKTMRKNCVPSRSAPNPADPSPGTPGDDHPGHSVPRR